MCAIIDANVSHQVFGSEKPSAGEKFFDWINTGKGRLVVGGKLRGELYKIGNFSVWAREAVLTGRMRMESESAVRAKTVQLKKQGRCESDDEHIIALTKVSGVRLLYSNDIELHEDFSNPRLISRPRGKIYTTNKGNDFSETHRGLLNRAACAAPGRKTCPTVQRKGLRMRPGSSASPKDKR